MMCIISKERIAFCGEVEGMCGLVFAASPIAFHSRCKRVPNEPIPTYGHNWPSTPECSFKIGDRQSEKKQILSDRRAICDTTHGIEAGRGVICHQGVSDGSDGAHPLWQSHSARMEKKFCWCSKLTPLQPPSSQNLGLHIYLHSCSITFSKCISKFTWSQPPTVPPNGLNYGLQLCMIMAFECITELARLQSQSASLHSLDQDSQMYLHICSVTTFKIISRPPQLLPVSPHDHDLLVSLQSPLTTLSQCFSEFTRSPPPSVTPNIVDCRPQVHLPPCWITFLWCTSQFTQSSFSDTP
jgi:hypothetical protein